MERRLHMTSRDGNFMIEGRTGKMGHAFMAAFRNKDVRFKRQRIKEVFQAYPDQIKVGVIYETT